MHGGTLRTVFRLGILYTDSFLRLTNRQRYSLLFGRYLNSWYSTLIPCLPYVPGFGPTKYWHTTKNDYPNRIKSDIKKIVQRLDVNEPIWHVAVNRKISTQPYQQTLKEKISTYIAGDISELWSDNEPDAETKCNYQRFYLFDIALAEKLGGPAWAFELINDWIDLNPPARNNAWDSFNCAVRLLNWIKLFHNAPGETFPDSVRWEKILGSIHAQLRCIHRGFRYEVPGNHVIIELFSLWLSSCLFTDIEEASRWKMFADERLAAEIHSQFLASGFHCEHSTHYHVQVTLIVLFWLHARDALGTPVPNALQQKIQKACAQIRRFLLPDGSVPLLGDGCFPFFHETVSQDMANINTLAAKVFPASKADHSNSTTFAISEIYPYVVATKNADVLIIDVGNIGLRNNPGHGHSDLLSFIYCSRGISIMIDPGTKGYANDPGCLQLKTADYHNTISVDGADHAQLWGYFRWAFLPDDPTYSTSWSSTKFTLKAQYLGFKHIGGIKHQRIISMESDELLIDDSVNGSGTHSISINFILHPLIDVAQGDGISLILSSGNHRWIFEYVGKPGPVITVTPIHVYGEYGLPVPSHKIAVIGKKSTDPFESRIALRYRSPDK